MGWRPLTAAVVLLVVAACTSDSKPKTSGASSASSSAPSAGSGALTLQGDPAYAGPIASPEVTCSFPTVDGLQIAVLAKASDDSFIIITIGPDALKVKLNSGPKEQTFDGRGVTGFDATRGATVDATLAGTTNAITAIKGSVECGEETPGSSTITVTGDTAAAHLEHARLDPSLVECYFDAGEVIVLGIAEGGGKKVHLLVSITTQGLGVEEELQPSGQRRYQGPLSAATISANGGRANGDVVEQDASPPHTLHVEGEAVCGTPLRG